MRAAIHFTAMTLAYLASIGIAYTVEAVHSAEDLSRGLHAEARIAQRSLNASLTRGVEQEGGIARVMTLLGSGEWN